jgi:putative sulfotransferase
VPALLQTTLPHLTKDCDHFFDQIRDFVFTQNPQLIENHYTVLFNFIQKSLNNKFWVERSGGSLRVVHRLHQMFPTAKFIHIVRDGRDCAISMSKHYGFKMVITAFQMIEILGCDPYEDDNRQFAGDLPDELYPLLPEHFNRKLFIEYDIPLSLYGHYWSGELIAASETLQKLPQKQLFTIQYEQLLQRPRESLEPLMSFMHVETDQQWISDVCETIRSPVSSWRNLSLEERKKLEDACSPGFEMLKKLGSGYD